MYSEEHEELDGLLLTGLLRKMNKFLVFAWCICKMLLAVDNTIHIGHSTICGSRYITVYIEKHGEQLQTFTCQRQITYSVYIMQQVQLQHYQVELNCRCI